MSDTDTLGNGTPTPDPLAERANCIWRKAHYLSTYDAQVQMLATALHDLQEEAEQGEFLKVMRKMSAKLEEVQATTWAEAIDAAQKSLLAARDAMRGSGDDDWEHYEHAAAMLSSLIPDPNWLAEHDKPVAAKARLEEAKWWRCEVDFMVRGESNGSKCDYCGCPEAAVHLNDCATIKLWKHMAELERLSRSEETTPCSRYLLCVAKIPRRSLPNERLRFAHGYSTSR